MTDPHVVALNYSLEHRKSVAYRHPPPLVREEPQFRLVVKDGEARFEFKAHFDTEREAREAIADYLESWQMSANLEGGPDSLRLVFRNAEIIDRQPQPGAVHLRASVRAGTPRGLTHLTLTPRRSLPGNR